MEVCGTCGSGWHLWKWVAPVEVGDTVEVGGTCGSELTSDTTLMVIATGGVARKCFGAKHCVKSMVACRVADLCWRH